MVFDTCMQIESVLSEKNKTLILKNSVLVLFWKHIKKRHRTIVKHIKNVCSARVKWIKYFMSKMYYHSMAL